jgi:hypothetical protein
MASLAERSCTNGVSNCISMLKSFRGVVISYTENYENWQNGYNVSKTYRPGIHVR